MSITKPIQQAVSLGQFSRALSLIDDALNSSSDSPQSIELQYLQIVTLRLSGQTDKALNLAQQLVTSQQGHARSFQELGYLQLTKSNPGEAAKAFYLATQKNPALIASWKALLPLYQQTQNHAAQNIAQAQIEYLSSLPKELLGARDLMYDGQLHKADQICRRYLQSRQHDKEGLLLLAEIGIRLKIYGEAEFILDTCLQLYPDFAPAGFELLKLLTKMGKFKPAAALADKLLTTQPDNKQLLIAKATALVGVGDVEQANSIYQNLLNANPDQPAVHLLQGHALKADGQFDQAVKSYQMAYHYRADFGDAFWSLANTKTYRFSDDEMTKMHSQLTRDALSLDDTIHMLFALGKAYEDRQDFSQSFDFYAKGNELKRQQTGYQPEQFEQQVAAQKRVCTAALFEQHQGYGEPRRDPIFIVGLPRAGSTLLEQILASHSQVDGTMELHNILGLVTKLRTAKTSYPDTLANIDSSLFGRFGEQFLNDTQVYRQGAAHFIDKMPNNFLHIGLIKLMLPNAKVIDARRHPMACCFSGFKQLFGEGQEFTYGLENIGRYYKSYVELMAHWDEVLPGFVLRVQHEDVVDDLEGQVRRILQFCELPFEQNCINFHQTKRTIKTPSSEQVRQPIYRTGVAHWKHFSEHLGPLQELVGNLAPRSRDAQQD